MGVVQVQASLAKLLKTFSSHPLHVHWISWVDPFIQALHGSEGGTNAKHLHQLDGATYVIHIAESNPWLIPWVTVRHPPWQDWSTSGAVSSSRISRWWIQYRLVTQGKEVFNSLED